MRPLDFPLFTDENIDPEVVQGLLTRGKEVLSALGEGLGGRDDSELLRYAHARGRVVVTHDSDFGTLVIRAGEPYTGIIYLRPGHISADFVLEVIDAIDSAPLEVLPPFLVTAERKRHVVRVRVRSGGSE